MTTLLTRESINAFSMKEIILVSGPIKSGKSKWAEHIISSSKNVAYIATGFSNPNDYDWNEKVRIHRERRPDSWKLVEVQEHLISSIVELSNYNLIIDSLGGYVSSNLNLGFTEWNKTSQDLIQIIQDHTNTIVVVLEEVGWSVVPTTKIGNLFRERLGFLAQELQNISTQSWLVVQGRAINLKTIGEAVP